MRRSWWVLVLVALLGIAACGDDGGGGGSIDASAPVDGAIADVAVVDAIPPTIDAASDAPVDAAVVDAEVADAEAVDAAIVDAHPPDAHLPPDAHVPLPPDAHVPLPPDADLPEGLVCDPVHQVGCGAGQKCDLAASGNFDCVPDGHLADFRVCDPTRPNACAAGFTCRGTNFGDNRCARLCTVAEQDDLCRSSEPCTSVRTTTDGHEYRMCKSPNACNPILDDCANTAQQCTWSELGGFCLLPGTAADGATCTSSAQCKRGSSCLPGAVGQPRKCFHLCDPGAATSSCAGGAECTFFSTTGPQAIGACGYSLP